MANIFNNKFIEASLIVFLLLGMVLRWLHVDERAVALNIGLLIFGLYSLSASVWKGDYKRFNLDFMKIVFSVTMILFSCSNLFSDNRHYSLLVVNTILLIMISERKRFAFHK